MQELNNQGKILSAQADMAACTQSFYKALYTRNDMVEINVQGHQNCFRNVPRVVTRGQNQSLERDMTLTEVQQAMKSLPTGKALGLDLIPAKFFQQCLLEVGPENMELVKEVLVTCKLSTSLNTSRIALVPKLGDLLQITNYCPISFLSTIYKIIAKLLANRLVSNLHKWIRSS